MSDLIPDDPEVDAQYRQLMAADPSAPSEATRRAILAQARQLAADRRPLAPHAAHRPGTRWGRTALLGTLAAAVVAGLIIVPHYLVPGASAPPESVAITQFDPPASLAVAPPPAVQPRVSTHVTSEHALARKVVPPAAAADNAAVAGKSIPPSAPVQEATVARSALAETKQGSTAGIRQQDSANFPARTSSAAAPAVGAAVSVQEADPGARLRHAAQIGDLAQLQALARDQTDLNARDASGRTALLLATLNGQADAVAALLAYGADPSIADAQGVTPLQAARTTRAAAIVATLERYGVQ